MAVKFEKGGKEEKPKSAAVPSFMKKGAAAQGMLEKDEEKSKAKQAEYDKPRRFWMKPETDTSITFLDGKLDEDGVLDAPMFHEHQLQLNGSWDNHFVCVAEQEPCPICEQGDDSRLVAAFTIIDHSVFEGKKGVYRDNIKLFVVKRETFKLLQKLATKRGGLAGCTFDVSRTSKNEANVGNAFDYTEKRGRSALEEAYPELKGKVKALDYTEMFPYATGDELREMGFGGTVTGAEKPLDEGGVQSSGGGQQPAGGGGSSDYDDEL